MHKNYFIRKSIALITFLSFSPLYCDTTYYYVHTPQKDVDIAQWHDAPQCTQDFINEELRKYLSQTLPVKLNPHLSGDNDLMEIRYRTVFSKPMLTLSASDAYRICKASGNDKPIAGILPKDEIHVDAEAQANLSKRIQLLRVALRHEIGQLYYKEAKKNYFSAVLSSVACATTAFVGTAVNARSAEEWPAASSLFGGGLIGFLAAQELTRWRDNHADDFAITHTSDPEELEAMTEYFKEQNDQRNKSILKSLFYFSDLFQSHYSPKIRYKKFCQAAQMLRNKQESRKDNN